MLRVMRSSENLTALALHVCLLVKASASALAALPWVRPTHTQTSWFYWFTSTCLTYHIIDHLMHS